MIKKNEDKEPLYLNHSQPIEKRVKYLISRMTIKEKIAQLGSQYATSLMERNYPSQEKMKRLIGQGIGQITRIAGTMNVEPGIIDVYIRSIHSNHTSGQLDLFEDLISHKDVKLKGKFKITNEIIHLSQDKEFFLKIEVKKKE